MDMIQASEGPWDPETGNPKPPTPDATTYGAAITACSKGRQWQMCLRFLEDMEKKVGVAVFSFRPIDFERLLCRPVSNQTSGVESS